MAVFGLMLLQKRFETGFLEHRGQLTGDVPNVVDAMKSLLFYASNIFTTLCNTDASDVCAI